MEDPLAGARAAGVGIPAGPVSMVVADPDAAAPAGGVPDDPQLGWHIAAINAEGAWADYTGAGVLVGLVDDGVHHWHTDLDDNYDTARDFDARGGDDDAAAESGDYHGTWVAGMVAAEANGAGTVGVSYEAAIAGFRMGYGSAGSLGQVEAVIRQSGQTTDISNNSWGFTSAFSDNFKAWYFADSADALRDGVADGRGGLGTVYVFAAGNGRTSGDDANYHNFQNSPYTIAVAATTSTGDHAYYSNPGAALLLAAPGSSVTTTSSGSGYATVSGTSFAAPTVSGVVALMLEANPDLGYRDVQEILAYSARLTDAGDPGWQVTGAGDWNGGGLRFSHDYGFGIVDATAAVRLAETWTAQSTYHDEVSFSASRAPGLAIPDNNPAGIVDSLTIAAADAIDIDTVEIDVSITHTFIGDLKVTLTSPEGTEAVLANRPGGAGNGADNINFVFSANTFWGESGAGTWQLRVYDLAGADVGTLNSWTLTLNGDPLTDDDTYVYTDDYGGFSGADLASRETLADALGHDVLNLSAVSAGVDVHLMPGGAGTIAGNPIAFDPSTVIEDVYLGDGDDSLTANDADNLIVGGRGDDSLAGAAGSDSIDGGGGDDTLRGGDGDDAVSGGDGADLIEGNMGDDTLAGGAGTDTLFGLGGTDTLTGGLGVDTLFGGDDADRLSGGDGDDELFGQGGGDVLEGGQGADKLFGGAGDDSLSGGDGDDVGYGDLGIDRISGDAGDDRLFGGDGADSLTGDAGSDRLYGQDGNDALDGGGGTDTLFGGGGDDALDGGEADDTLFGFDGLDTLNGGDGADTLFGGNDGDTLGGDGGGDIIHGQGGGDVVAGGTGDDTVYAGVGDDDVDGGAGQDWLFGDGGADRLAGGADADRVFGGDGDDTLDGGEGADDLRGGVGNDTLSGGAGDDILNGGAGADVFVFAAGAGIDRIQDFGVGIDGLVLVGLTVTGTVESDVNFDGAADTVVSFSSGDTAELIGVSGIADPDVLLA